MHRSTLTLNTDEQVAGLWLQARLAGLNPNEHVAKEMRISRTAAAARVKRVRDAKKMIPQARQGQRR